MIFLKPLLICFSYTAIRKLLLCAQLILTGAVIVLMGVRKKLRFAPAFVAAWLFLNPRAIGMSLQFSSMTLLMLCTMAAVLLCGNRLEGCGAVPLLFSVGCLASFFDLLTFPLITLGIPLACILVSQRTTQWKNLVITFLGCCMAWTAGYALMWASKWVLASLITGENVISNAISALQFRMGATAGDQAITWQMVFDRNREIRPDWLRLCELLAGAAIVIFGLKAAADRHFREMSPLCFYWCRLQQCLIYGIC